jgi:hypothetical protein
MENVVAHDIWTAFTMLQSPTKLSFAAFAVSVFCAPSVAGVEYRSAGVARQASITCPNVPMQTAWQYVTPPRNAKIDFGPPNVGVSLLMLDVR